MRNVVGADSRPSYPSLYPIFWKWLRRSCASSFLRAFSVPFLPRQLLIALLTRERHNRQNHFVFVRRTSTRHLNYKLTKSTRCFLQLWKQARKPFPLSQYPRTININIPSPFRTSLPRFQTPLLSGRRQ